MHHTECKPAKGGKVTYRYIPYCLLLCVTSDVLPMQCLYVCAYVVVCVSPSGHGGELLGYWKQLDQSLSVMAAQYYTALRSIEEQQEG